MKVLLAALLVCSLVPSIAPPAAAGEIGGIMTRYDLTTGIGETVLENGLTVLTLERHDAPVVSCQIWYRVGSVDELPGETGLAHFLEHLMFKGTDRYAKGEIDRITLELGGANNAATSNDWTYYYFNFASDRYETALEIEANRMRNLLFDPVEFEAERKVVVEELLTDRDGPWGELDETAQAVAYLAHGYRHPIIGWKSDLLAVPRERVKAFYDRFYHPRNATLVLVGDFDTKEALSRVVEHFGPIPAGPDPEVRRSAEPEQTGERRVLVRRDTELVRMTLLYHSAAASDPDDVVLDVLRNALVLGKSSRLGRRLVEDEQVVTFVDAANDTRREPGLFWIYAELMEDADPEAVEEAIHEETARFAAEGPTEDELARAKKALLVDLAVNRATAERTAEEIGYWASVGDWRGTGDRAERIEAVGADDVRRVAARLFRTENRTVALAVPEEDDAGAAGAAGGSGAEPRRSPRRRHRGRSGDASGPRVHLAPQVVRLDNGLTLLLARNATVPLLSVEAYVDAGRIRESVPGLGRFTGECLLEGAGGRDAVTLDEELGRLGIDIDATATGLSAQCLAEDAARAVPLLADLLRRPDFPASGVEKVRDRTLSELRADEDDPQRVARQAFDAAIYGDHPLGRPDKGTLESVAGITREDVAAHHARLFVPGNTVIAAVSSLPPEELVPLFTAAFADWTGETPPPPELPEIAAPAPRRVEIERDTDQVNLWLGHRGIRRDDPDYYPLLVMDYVLGLGPGFTDRLSKTLRDRDGLAYTVWASVTRNADREPGTFAAYIGTSASQKARALAGIEAEIRRIREEPVTEAELAAAKAYLTGSFVFAFETGEQVARRLVDIERLGLGFDYPERFAERVSAVTAADVLRVARAHLHPDALTIVTAGPK